MQEITTHIDITKTPDFGTPEPVSLGETLDPEAQTLLRGLEKSREQLLWKKWARRPSGSPAATSLHSGGAVASDLSPRSADFSFRRSQSTTEQPVGDAATSPLNKKKSRSQSILNPPSPLDAGGVSQDIQSWMKTASADQRYSKQRVDESHFSISSEEGIYFLSAVDSDGEACGCPPDLDKEVFQPYTLLKRKVPRVEEEEELFLTEESKHLELCETGNSRGCTFELGQNVESGLRAESAAQRTCDWNKNKSISRVTVNNTDVFDVKPEEENSHREERLVGEQSNDDGDYCGEEKTEDATAVTHGYDKTQALRDEARKTNVEVENWRKSERRLLEKCGQVSEETAADREEREDDLTTYEEGEDKTAHVKEEERGSQQNNGTAVCKASRAAVTAGSSEHNDGKGSVSRTEDLTRRDEDEDENSHGGKNSMGSGAILGADVRDKECRAASGKLKATATDHPGKGSLKNDTCGGVNDHSSDTAWTPAGSAAAQSSR